MNLREYSVPTVGVVDSINLDTRWVITFASHMFVRLLAVASNESHPMTGELPMLNILLSILSISMQRRKKKEKKK